MSTTIVTKEVLPFESLGTKWAGDYCVSLCCTYFMAHGYQVLTPMGDKGKYDLVTEKDGIFKRVQSKWTKRKTDSGYPKVSLRVLGSTSVNEGQYVYGYKSGDFDVLWVGTPEACYCIPAEVIYENKEQVREFKVYPKHEIYRVALPIPTPSNDATHRRYSPALNAQDKALIKRLTKAEKPQEEIAQMLGVTRGCVSTFLSRDAKKRKE